MAMSTTGVVASFTPTKYFVGDRLIQCMADGTVSYWNDETHQFQTVMTVGPWMSCTHNPKTNVLYFINVKGHMFRCSLVTQQIEPEPGPVPHLDDLVQVMVQDSIMYVGSDQNIIAQRTDPLPEDPLTKDPDRFLVWTSGFVSKHATMGCMLPTPHPSRVFLDTWAGNIQQWDLSISPPRRTQTFRGDKSCIMGMLCTGSELFAITRRGNVLWWTCETAGEPRILTHTVSRLLAYCQATRQLYTTFGEQVFCWDLTSDEQPLVAETRSVTDFFQTVAWKTLQFCYASAG